MDTYAVCNQKGGVGKTADTINLGAALAEAGERVLVVDYDPQGHLSEGLKLAETREPATLYQAMTGTYTGDVRALVTTVSDGLDALPTNIDGFLLESGLYQCRAREERLARVLEGLEPHYDVCLIDCPPSLGVLTDNALFAARRRPGRRGGVLIPVTAEDPSIRALRLLLDQVHSLAAALRVDVDVVGLVVNLYDARRGRVVTSMLEAFKALQEPPVLAVVGDRKEVREAWRAGHTVLEHAPNSEAAAWYRELAATVRAPERVA